MNKKSAEELRELKRIKNHIVTGYHRVRKLQKNNIVASHNLKSEYHKHCGVSNPAYHIAALNKKIRNFRHASQSTPNVRYQSVAVLAIVLGLVAIISLSSGENHITGYVAKASGYLNTNAANNENEGVLLVEQLLVEDATKSGGARPISVLLNANIDSLGEDTSTNEIYVAIDATISKMENLPETSAWVIASVRTHDGTLIWREEEDINLMRGEQLLYSHQVLPNQLPVEIQVEVVNQYAYGSAQTTIGSRQFSSFSTSKEFFAFLVSIIAGATSIYFILITNRYQGFALDSITDKKSLPNLTVAIAVCGVLGILLVSPLVSHIDSAITANVVYDNSASNIEINSIDHSSLGEHHKIYTSCAYVDEMKVATAQTSVNVALNTARHVPMRQITINGITYNAKNQEKISFKPSVVGCDSDGLCVLDIICTYDDDVGIQHTSFIQVDNLPPTAKNVYGSAGSKADLQTSYQNGEIELEFSNAHDRDKLEVLLFFELEEENVGGIIATEFNGVTPSRTLKSNQGSINYDLEPPYKNGHSKIIIWDSANQQITVPVSWKFAS